MHPWTIVPFWITEINRNSVLVPRNVRLCSYVIGVCRGVKITDRIFGWLQSPTITHWPPSDAVGSLSVLIGKKAWHHIDWDSLMPDFFASDKPTREAYKARGKKRLMGMDISLSWIRKRRSTLRAARCKPLFASRRLTPSTTPP